MKNLSLFTIGYEGRTLDELLSCLRQNNVNLLIDVRDVPWSRKKGFTEAELKKMLPGAGIEYVHIKALGNPALLRNKLKNDGDHEYFRKALTEYLAGQEQAIGRAHDLIMNNTCCLMCFERDPLKCHRSIVAEKIQAYDGNGLKTAHLI